MRNPSHSGSLLLGIGLVAGIAGFISPCSAAEQWWEQKPLRIIDLVTSFGRAEDQPAVKQADLKADQFYNAEHLEVMELNAGLDDRGFFFKTSVAPSKNDFLAGYLPEAKRRGLRVLIYFNVHWYKKDFGKQHADWLQIREDGRPIDGVYQTGTDFCVNSPWRDWVFQIVRDLTAYPIDGIFYDGPIFFPDTCYCKYCQEKYRKLHGKSLPSKKERRGAGAQELLAFQAQSIADFLRDTRTILKAKSPGLALYMNGGVRGGNWSTARLNRVLIEEQDLLGSEGGFIGGDLTRTSLWKPSLTARLLESQSGGKPRVIFSAAGHKPWTFSVLPAAELRLMYAATIANAASVWFGLWPSEFTQPEMKTLAEMNQFLARNQEYYHQTRSEARMAVVWSDVTANFYSGSDAQLLEMDRVAQRSAVGNLDAEFSGVSEALMRTLVPFDVLDDVSLDKGDLSRYQTIFLPNVACMSDQTAQRLREYVRGGGVLFSTFETSLYDDAGIRRKEFALADVFGATATASIAGPSRWDYMKRVTQSNLLTGIGREFLSSPVYHLRVKAREAHEVTRYTKPLAGVYDGIPELSEDPALMSHPFGKGHAIYFTGDLGNAIETFHLYEHLQLIGNTVREFAPSQVTVQNAPSSVEVVVRSQSQRKRLLLHLINYTGEMTRPIQKVLPLTNVQVTLNGMARPSRIYSLFKPANLPMETLPGGKTRFVLPQLDEYEVVVIEN
jgi:hypothetical protein